MDEALSHPLRDFFFFHGGEGSGFRNSSSTVVIRRFGTFLLLSIITRDVIVMTKHCPILCETSFFRGGGGRGRFRNSNSTVIIRRFGAFLLLLIIIARDVNNRRRSTVPSSARFPFFRGVVRKWQTRGFRNSSCNREIWRERFFFPPNVEFSAEEEQGKVQVTPRLKVGQ